MGERGKLRDRGDAAAGLAEPRDLSERLLQEATRWIPVVDGAERSLLVFVADEQMRYVAVSESVCDLLGYRQEELLALGVTDVAVEETAAAEYTELVEAGVRVGLATIRARDGRLFDFSYSATEVALDGQRLFASVGQVLEGGNLAGRTAGDLRLVVADDHEPTRLLVRTLLGFVEGVELVGEAKDGVEAISLVAALDPDVVLLDVQRQTELPGSPPDLVVGLGGVQHDLRPRV